MIISDEETVRVSAREAPLRSGSVGLRQSLGPLAAVTTGECVCLDQRARGGGWGKGRKRKDILRKYSYLPITAATASDSVGDTIHNVSRSSVGVGGAVNTANQPYTRSNIGGVVRN